MFQHPTFNYRAWKHWTRMNILKRKTFLSALKKNQSFSLIEPGYINLTNGDFSIINKNIPIACTHYIGQSIKNSWTSLFYFLIKKFLNSVSALHFVNDSGQLQANNIISFDPHQKSLWKSLLFRHEQFDSIWYCFKHVNQPKSKNNIKVEGEKNFPSGSGRREGGGDPWDIDKVASLSLSRFSVNCNAVLT